MEDFPLGAAMADFFSTSCGFEEPLQYLLACVDGVEDEREKEGGEKELGPDLPLLRLQFSHSFRDALAHVQKGRCNQA